MGIGDFLDDAAKGWWHGVEKGWNSGFKSGSDVGDKVNEKAYAVPILGTGLERVMHGMAWTWDNGVSQPMSTWLLAGTHVENGNFGDLFKASAWAKAWHVANHVSPGQAFWANHGEVEEILKDRPLYLKPGAAYLPSDWKDMSEDEQQQFLGEHGMPVVGNRAVEKIKRDVSFFNFASGSTDFAARWWLDPTVLGGKAVGAARGVQLGRMPTVGEATKAALWSRQLPDDVAIPTRRPKDGWTGQSIGQLMDSSRMAKVQDFIWTNKDQPDLINNLSMFKKSGLGPRAGSIISQLKSPEEVNLFIRTTLGDAEARTQLESENAAAGLRMSAVDERISKLELETIPNLGTRLKPGAEAMLRSHIDDLKAKLDGDEDLVARYDAALRHYGEMDALNVTRWSGRRAQIHTADQRNFRTGPALGSVSVREDGVAGSKAAKASGIAKTRIYAKDMFGSSATLIRSFAEAHPNGMMAIDDIHPEAVDELRGQISRIPGIGPNIRASLLNNYLKTTTEGERLALLEDIEGLAVTKVAEKHGFTYDEGMKLYREHRSNITRVQDELRRYSGANFPDVPGQTRQSVDIFAGADGRLRPHPNLVTKLVNNRIMIDLDLLEKTLARNASPLKALRTKPIGNTDWLVNTLDWTMHLWKFGQLGRLGYIPRIIGEELFGHMARLGAGAMAARTGYGVKNLATNLAHWKAPSHYEAAEAVAREGVKYADEEIKALQPEVDRIGTSLERADAVYRTDLGKARTRATKARNTLAGLDQAADPVKYAAMRQLSAKLDQQAAEAQRRLETHSPARRERLGALQEQMDELLSGRDGQLTAASAAKELREKGFRQSSQLYKSVEAAPGVVLPPAFGGVRGEYYMKLSSSDDSLRTMLQKNQQLVHSNLQKAYSSRSAAPISYPGQEAVFVEAWHKAINHMIMQDEFARQAVRGDSAESMARWLKSTAAGRAYRKRLGIKYDAPERIAASVWHEVDEYMPKDSGVREAALNNEADIEYLTEMAKTGQYPQYVHSAQLGEALAGSNHASQAMDRVVDWFYKWASSIPADRMSRHPLFNQLYEGHARALAGQELKQGVKITQKDADRLAETARRLALKDTRKLVFDIAHRSDAGHALRFMSPFFAATAEAWQRWARIIADRPQTAGYASIFFNAPISWGWMQDSDGNTIQKDGTSMVWDEKANRLVPKFVPKSERYIMARVPKFIAGGPIGKVWGMDSSGSWKISQDSMNLVTQGDPWFNPGTGPIVAIPASLLVQDKPKQAELLRHLGVLPFGPTPGGITQTFVQQMSPAYARNFFTAYDTSDERYQRIKLQIMQRAAYEHANLGKPMPSAQEIADRTKNYWRWAAVTAFTQPFATQKPDKYQFYRDQYNALRRKNPLTADQEFLDRFEESHFVFAQATTENEGGVPATMKAVELQKKYADVIAKNPELAALIIGPEGDGPFSPEAYAYQLSSPLVPGGAEAQRTRLSAEEAMAENQRRLGWAEFTRLNNKVTAELHSAGFDSFEDEGAEQLKVMRSSIAKLLGDPLLPDGSENRFYNEQWSKDYYTIDPKRYDRLIPGLTAVANSDMAKLQDRSDLRVLQNYLGYRRALNQMLNERDQAGGSLSLAAKSNADLAGAWNRIVDGLVESDTRFGDLYHRYLSRDMGVATQEEVS